MVRRKLRQFSIQDYPACVDSPPRMRPIERGELTVRFLALEELAAAMLYLATVFTDGLDSFGRLYEPTPKISEEEAEILQEARSEADFYRNWQHSLTTV